MYPGNQRTEKPFLEEEDHTKEFCPKFKFLDVFAFVPTPMFSPFKQSSFRSLCFSIVFIIGMIGYAYTTFHVFLTNNVPKTSLQRQSIDNVEFKMPNFALTFVPNMDQGVSLVNKSYYSIAVSQGSLYEGLNKTKTEIAFTTNYSCSPSWLPKMNFTDFICPGQSGVMSGNLFTSKEFKFIKIDFLTCVQEEGSDLKCADPADIEKLLIQGRLFLFVQQDDALESIGNFKTLFFYPTPKYYQRSEIYIKNEVVIESPDYYHTFTKSTKQGLFYDKEKAYVSSKPPKQQNLLYSIWLRLSEEELITTKQPSTLTDVFSKWGALWSGLLLTFGLYFWKFNKRLFYDTNPEWEYFGKTAQEVIITKQEKIA